MTQSIVLEDPSQKVTLNLSRMKASKLLNIADASVQLLLDSGYLPDLDAYRILTLANYPIMYAKRNYPVIQQSLGEKGSTPSEGTRMGEHASYSHDQCLQSNRGPWSGFRDTDMIDARFIPVTLRKFTISVLEITGTERGSDDGTLYTANLVGRVRELGSPHFDYISPDLSDDDRRTVTALMYSRSSSNVPGPCGKLKIAQ